MTGAKISQLTTASVFNDADIVPIVQSGTTKSVSGALLKAGVAPASATESTEGIIEIATTAEAESRTEDSKAMTSKKVQDWADAGIILNGATGGDQGDGTINAAGFYVDGELVGSGGLVLIETQTVSSPVAQVAFTSGIDSTYDRYLVTISGLYYSSADRPQFQYSTNGGSSYSNPTATENTRVSATVETHTNTAGRLVNNSITGANSAITAFSGELLLRGFGSGTLYKTARGFIDNYSGGAANRCDTAQYINTATAVDAFKILGQSANNIAGGTLSLYGIVK